MIKYHLKNTLSCCINIFVSASAHFLPEDISHQQEKWGDGAYLKKKRETLLHVIQPSKDPRALEIVIHRRIERTRTHAHTHTLILAESWRSVAVSGPSSSLALSSIHSPCIIHTHNCTVSYDSVHYSYHNPAQWCSEACWCTDPPPLCLQ